jgi:hypothetical protein
MASWTFRSAALRRGRRLAVAGGAAILAGLASSASGAAPRTTITVQLARATKGPVRLRHHADVTPGRRESQAPPKTCAAASAATPAASRNCVI